MRRRLLSISKKAVATQCIIKFCENKMSFDEFWKEYIENENIRKLLLNNLNNFHIYTFRDYIMDIENIKKIDITNLEIRLTIFRFLKNFLLSMGYKIESYSPDEYLYNLLSQAIPDWLRGQKMDIFINIFDNIGPNLTIDQRLKKLKQSICETFIFIDYPPKWLQTSEWPVVSGKPLIFCRQSQFPEDISHESNNIVYYFKNKEGDSTTEVVQFD